MKSKICIVGVNFYPEETSTGLYSTQMAQFLLKNNCEVSVVTGFPYYPEWSIRKDYLAKPRFYEEQINGLRLLRYKQYVPEKPNFKKRAVHLLDFTLGSLRNLFKIKRCDVVVCVVPFTSTIFLGWVLSRLRGAKLWVHIQDFEVDAILESGISSNDGLIKKNIFKALFFTEKFLFNRADVVSTISHGMMKKLEEKTIKETYYFPNWVSGDDINPERSSFHSLFKTHKDKFKILYSGNVGEKQDWDFFIEMLGFFTKNDAVHFFVVGQGGKFVEIQRKLSSFSNVTVREPVAFSELNDLLCSADLHVLFQKKEVVDTVMPSKILGMMASAVPSLVTGDMTSEVAKVFSGSQKDGFFKAGDIVACIQFLHLVMNDSESRVSIGKSARSYVLQNFDSNAVLQSFVKKLKQLV